MYVAGWSPFEFIFQTVSFSETALGSWDPPVLASQVWGL